MLRHSSRRSFENRIQNILKKYLFFQNIQINKNFYLLSFFFFLFFILFIRLLYLQIIKHAEYDQMLNQQHTSQTELQAKRGNIFADDKAGKHIQLTDNVTMYNVFADPKFIWDKDAFIKILIPIVYKHLCETYGMKNVTQIECIQNVENFTEREILPKKPEFFYFGSGIISSGYYLFDRTGFYNNQQQIISGFTNNVAYGAIKDRLNQMIIIGIKPKNYLGFFTNTDFLEQLEKLNLDYVDIQLNNYIYIVPDKIGNVKKENTPLKKLLNNFGYLQNFTNFDKLFEKQENRYVKIISNANPIIAQMVKDMKIKYYQIRSKDKIPLLNALGLESYSKRYYQYGSFLSNVLGFVDQNNNAFYGIEKFFDISLRGKDGKIIGRSSSWIGPVGANDFQIQDSQNGNDIYLTIDVGIQKQVETLIKKYNEMFKTDSISVLIYDPFDGSVKASANYPSFDPNNYNTAFQLTPLGPENANLIDNSSYVDVPVYINTGGEYKLAKTFERTDTSIPKYITKNIYGPQVLVDKNISMAYEPGSIFKAFTVGIGLDTDEMRFYDLYNDPGKVKVGQFEIKNADKACLGDWNFLHAFVYSCNVGMVRIAQKMGKDVFYNYLDKLGFGKLTNIELADEDQGFIEGVTSVSDARYFNNVFGQGLLATPIQIAAGYASLLNGGYYVQPTIIKGTFNSKINIYYPNNKKVVKQIFRPETSDAVKEGLFNVLDQNEELKLGKIPGYRLGGKSGTSQISYKGKYQNGIGWTNGSFVGIVTTDDPKYIVIIQLRRPRSSLRGGLTAGKIFGDIAKFLLNYSMIEKPIKENNIEK